MKEWTQNESLGMQMVKLVKQKRNLLLTASFLFIVLLWDRERLILKKESFFEAEEGGDDVLESRLTGRGGEDIAWSRPPDKLSELGEELMVLGVWPAR